MNRKITLLVLAVLGIIALTFYTYSGGFSSPDFTVVTSQPIYVAGRAFNGSIKDEQMDNAFRRAAEVLDKKELEGVLGSIYYNNPDTSGDSIQAFIGIVVSDSAVRLPADYALRVVPGGRSVVHGEVEAHYTMAPKRLYGGIFEYAKENNLQLEDFYVEWFPEDHKGMLQVPIKQ